ncbi:uncharacterized protein LJ206_010149 isoform 2-T4 [Theristicus caerulescens]
MKLTGIMQKQKMLHVASHGESKETVLTEKAVQTVDNQAGVTQHFLGTGKSSKENITGIHSNRESGSNISDEQDLFNVSSSFLKHKPPVECDKELQLLNQWYRQDENFVSSIYKPQPTRDIFSSDPVHRQQAKRKWLNSFQKRHKIFQEYAPLTVREEASTELLETVLQQEVDQGFKIQGSPEDRCCCFKRKICDLEYNLSSKQASKCFGIHLVKTEVNERKYEAHQNIIESVHAQGMGGVLVLLDK